MKYLFFSLGVTVFCITGTPVFAANTNINADEIFPQVDVANPTKPSDASGQVQYFAESSTTVAEPAQNDVFAFSGTVHIINTVDGDVFAAGNEVRIEKNVTGSVRVAGNTVVLKGSVTRNTLIIASTVVIEKGAELHGNVRIFADTLTMDGTIRGATTIQVKKIQGSGRYLAETVITAQNHLATIHNDDAKRVHLAESHGIDTTSLRGIATSFLSVLKVLFFAAFGMLAMIFGFPFISRAIPEFKARPFALFLRGIITEIVVICSLVLLTLTIVGIPFALVGLCFFILASWVGKTSVAYWIGLAITRKQPERLPTLTLLGTFLLGFIILTFAAQVPNVGWIIGFITMTIGLGAISLAIKK